MKKLSPLEQESKLKVLQDCMDEMDGGMGSHLDAKKKKKASIPEKKEESVSGEALIEAQYDSEDESEESIEEDTDEMTEEELDAKIAELMAKKKSK